MRKLKGKIGRCSWCGCVIGNAGTKINISQKYYIKICAKCNDSRSNAMKIDRQNVKKPYRGETGSNK